MNEPLLFLWALAQTGIGVGIGWMLRGEIVDRRVKRNAERFTGLTPTQRQAARALAKRNKPVVVPPPRT